jgi:hypothetical protein
VGLWCRAGGEKERDGKGKELHLPMRRIPQRAMQWCVMAGSPTGVLVCGCLSSGEPMKAVYGGALTRGMVSERQTAYRRS